MKAIADIGAVVEVTSNDEIWFSTNKDSSSYIDDRTPFRFRVDGYLLDGQIFYGLYGPVIQGPFRYLGLICNITIRIDGSDWRQERVSGANFKVGPSTVVRNHAFDFRHPEGTILAGYPTMGRYGHVEVIEPQQEQKTAEQSCPPNSHACGTFGTSPAKQAWVPKASGSR